MIRLVIDGIRRLADIKHLREIPGFFLVSVEASEELRHKRVIERNENPGDDKKTFADFLKDQNEESESEIPNTMAAADYVVNNDGSWDHLWDQIHDLVKKINELDNSPL